MFKEINVEEALNLTNPIFVDVRSEGEYTEDKLPLSINIPLFNNDERALVGTLYKQEGPDVAKLKGLELVSPKLTGIYQKISKLAENHQVVILCWRGGMRSLSLARIMDLMGLTIYRLQGGYKAYRQYVNAYLEEPLHGQQLVVLRGLTGVGKTGVIQHLQEMGVGAIDLEGLANHRGSAFGSVGLEEQPSQKLFESRLVKSLSGLKEHKYIVVECESKKIGRNILPTPFHQAMSEGPQILTYDSLENRVQRIIRIYTEGFRDNIEGLNESVAKLVKKLGKDKVADLQAKISAKNFADVVRVLLLEYYDPLYQYPSAPSLDYDFCVDTADEYLAAQKIKEYILSL